FPYTTLFRSPNEAVVEYLVKKPVNDLKLRVSDAAGKTVREIVVPGAKNQPGIQTVCRDMRGEAIPAGVDSAAEGAGRGGRGGGGGRGAAAPGSVVPGVSQPVPTPIGGVNPCAIEGAPVAGGRGGGGAFGGGGLGGPAPYVM